MSWRVVVVRGRCKLEYKLGYLVCRGEEVKKLFLNEISSLVVESTAVSLTAALLSELIKNKVNIVFCDENHNPVHSFCRFTEDTIAAEFCGGSSIGKKNTKARCGRRLSV